MFITIESDLIKNVKTNADGVSIETDYFWFKNGEVCLTDYMSPKLGVRCVNFCKIIY